MGNPYKASLSEKSSKFDLQIHYIVSKFTCEHNIYGTGPIYDTRKERRFNQDSLRREIQALADLLCSNKIEILNVAGARESKEPGVYEWTLAMLSFFLNRAVSRTGSTKTASGRMRHAARRVGEGRVGDPQLNPFGQEPFYFRGRWMMLSALLSTTNVCQISPKEFGQIIPKVSV
jgi:hypothetical protein